MSRYDSLRGLGMLEERAWGRISLVLVASTLALATPQGWLGKQNL